MIETTSLAAQTVSLLYPEPWTMTPGRVRDGREEREFLLVPNESGVRMIVPAGPRRALTAAMRQHASEARASTRMKRLAFGTLAASGLAGAGWPARLHIAGPASADSLERWLRRRLGLAPYRLAIRLGQPRANRKPVVQVLDQSGAVRAYVKIGHNALSTSLISTEAAVLAHLDRARLHRVRVPRVLAHDEWNGLRLLALEPLQVSGAAPDPAVLYDAAQEIAASAAQRTQRWRRSSFRKRLIAEIASCGTRLAPLNDVAARFDRTDPLIEFGAWHGDFNPGNFAAGRDGNFAAGRDGLLVWDWERYEIDVPVGFDMLHLAIQRDITVTGRAPGEAAADLLADAGAPRADRLVGRSPDDEGRATGVDIARLYLAWLACRYVRDGQDRAGAAVGAVEQWILPALAGVR